MHPTRFGELLPRAIPLALAYCWAAGLAPAQAPVLAPTADVAIVDGEYLTGNNARPLWTTIVVQRVAPGWRISAIRNAAPTSATTR